MSSAPIGSTGAAADLHERAEELLDRARAAGAAEAEVYGTGGTSLSAKMEKGDLGQVQSDEGSTCGLRVILDGRLGFASTNQASDQAQTLADEAVAIARLSPDPANVLPSPPPSRRRSWVRAWIPRRDHGVQEVVEGPGARGCRVEPRWTARWTRPRSRRSQEATWW